jgi:hypothetical protein
MLNLQGEWKQTCILRELWKSIATGGGGKQGRNVYPWEKGK